MLITGLALRGSASWLAGAMQAVEVKNVVATPNRYLKAVFL